MGGDYQDGRTLSVTHHTGGQTVFRNNQRGTVYYEHDFFAKSIDDLTPTDWIVAPRNIDLGLYLQDSWKPAAGRTVNAGLRWHQEDIRDYRDQSVIKTTGEWQPRLGVVWDPSRDG